jgi:hypothetical protein
MKFTYRWGQRPLDGFTIKRGLGHGGFGEVYFAISDGGKEVALKLIRGHSDTELRGTANCLNLKHPNLVHLYDLKVDAQGDRWLVMEYIQGEPLSLILNRSARGLPETQAREWFLQTARAVAYLHDHAVVHRDIKPANIFVENGVVKLGDYGLCKAVSHSQNAQSSNVGTIHYMAPEIASGAYSKQIDVYACGVVLYEMLTGEVPFKGESWGEIAIKHQTDLPDLKKVPAAYVSILQRALDKKAEKRFADMEEMIRAVEAAGKPVASARAQVEPATPASVPVSVKPQVAPQTPAPARKWSELTSSLLLAPIPALPAAAVWAAFTGSVNWGELASLFLIMVLTSWVVLLAARLWEGRSSDWARRYLLGLLGAVIGVGAFWLDGWMFPEIVTQDEATPAGLHSYWGGVLRAEPGGLEALTGFVLFFGLALSVPRWWQAAGRRRPERFSLWPLIAAGVWGMILLTFWTNAAEPNKGAPPRFLVLALAGAAAVVQLVSPWVKPAPGGTRYRRRLQPAPKGRAA